MALKVSPSAAHRWLQCTASVRLSEGEGKEGPSEFAEEGTLAHSVAERCLTSGKDAWEFASEEVDADMIEGVQAYADYCRDITTNGTNVQAEVEVKWEADYASGTMSGTADFACLLTEDDDTLTLHVVDFKYGHTPIEAENNPQLMIYALGVMELWGRPFISSVFLHIVQPRSRDLVTVRRWGTTQYALETWETDTLQPKMLEAYGPNGLFSAGEWCKYCPVKYRCPELERAFGGRIRELEENMKSLDRTPVEQLEILHKSADALAGLRAQLWRELRKRVIGGEHSPSYKVVEKQTQRIWNAPAADIASAAQAGLIAPSQLFDEPVLKSPAKVEKLPGGKEFVARYAHFPKGGPTIVERKDPRPEKKQENPFVGVDRSEFS